MHKENNNYANRNSGTNKGIIELDNSLYIQWLLLTVKTRLVNCNKFFSAGVHLIFVIDSKIMAHLLMSVE